MTRRTFALVAAAKVAAVKWARGADVPERPLFRQDHVPLLERAYREWRNLPQNDKRSWKRQADLHSKACGELNVHETWLFLPWHRAFLSYHERTLRTFLPESDRAAFRLPVWNWEANANVPGAYRAPFGGPLWPQNPLSAQGQFHRREIVDDPAVLADGLTDWLTSADWGTFHGSASVHSPHPHAACGAHKAVHERIGGIFGSFAGAAEEPLFFLHHANVDRYWDHWKTLHHGEQFNPPQNWLDEELKCLIDENGDEVTGRKVSEFVDSSELGYRNVPVTVPSVVRPVVRFDAHFAGGRVQVPDRALDQALAGGSEPGLESSRSRDGSYYLSLSGTVVGNFEAGRRYRLGAVIDNGRPVRLGTFSQLSKSHHDGGTGIIVRIPRAVAERLTHGNSRSFALVYRPGRVFGRWEPVQQANLRFLVAASR